MAEKLWLAWQSLAELVHETQGVLGGLVGQMQINHRGGDLLMTEQLLDGVQMRAGLEQVRGKTVTQGINIITTCSICLIITLTLFVR